MNINIGISGSTGVFYLALHCFIADITTNSSRSYRITLLNNLNSIASIIVTFICGYVIKYYGFIYVFIMALFFMFTALVYTIFVIYEPLVELRDKSFLSRLRMCSFRRILNPFKVYFSHTDADDDEQSRLLLNNVVWDKRRTKKKQTFVLLLIVFANLVYVFAASGVGSIFTLFIMNAPYCFDSVLISKFSVFATVVSLIASFGVSKFFKVNDLLICLVSVASYFSSLLFYMFGNKILHVFLCI
jgi:hypothetical protein